MARKDPKGRVLKKGESYHKDKKLYMYRWTDRLGERQCTYAATLNELRQKELEIVQELSLGVSRKKITLNQQIEKYLKVKTSLANSTKENYQYYYEHDLKESILGNMLLSDILKSDILLFYKEKHDKGYKNGTIHILHKIIHPALELAVDDKIIISNPSKGCMKEYSKEGEKKYALTLEQEEEFLQRILMRKYIKKQYPFYGIMLQTGLRISEVIGLTWNDVDMTKKEISINHQMHYRKKDGKVRFYCTDETKTESGIRVIPMTDRVYRLFKEQRKIWFEIDRDSEYEVDGYSNFVFLSYATGRPLYHTRVREQLDAIVEMNKERDVQLPHISPHILRHTACTRYAEAGLDVKAIQYLMGQTDIKTTMKVYNHVDQSRAQRALSKFEEWSKKNADSTPILHQFGVKA